MRFLTIITSCALPLAVAATGGHTDNHAKRHHELTTRKHVQTFNLTQPINVTERALEKRGAFNNARFSFYDVGLGACGKVNVASDFIVAMSVTQFGDGYPGPNCFRPIQIEFGGKSANAVIMDECIKCPYGGLDFSRGLFDHFASEDVGIIYGTWWFTDEGDNGDTTTTTSKAPAPKTTTSHKPTSTSTSTTSTTSRTSTTSTTHTTTSTTPATTITSTVTSTSSIDISEGVASGIAQTTGAEAPAQTAGDVLNLLTNGVIYLGAIVVAGAQAEN